MLVAVFGDRARGEPRAITSSDVDRGVDNVRARFDSSTGHDGGSFDAVAVRRNRGERIVAQKACPSRNQWPGIRIRADSLP